MPLSERDYMQGEPPDDAPFVWDDIQHRYIRRAEYAALYGQRQAAPTVQGGGGASAVSPTLTAARPSYRLGWLLFWLLLMAVAAGVAVLLLHLFA